MFYRNHLLNAVPLLQVLMETLRMHPPAAGIGKEAAPGGLDVGGYHIPGGTPLIVRMLMSVLYSVSNPFLVAAYSCALSNARVF